MEVNLGRFNSKVFFLMALPSCFYFMTVDASPNSSLNQYRHKGMKIPFIANTATALSTVHLSVLEEALRSTSLDALQAIARLALEVVNSIEMFNQLRLGSWIQNVLINVALVCVRFVHHKETPWLIWYSENQREVFLRVLSALRTIRDIAKTRLTRHNLKLFQQISQYKEIRKNLKTLKDALRGLEDPTLRAMSQDDLKKLLVYLQQRHESEISQSSGSAPTSPPDHFDDHTKADISFLENAKGANFSGNTSMVGTLTGTTSNVTLNVPNATLFSLHFGYPQVQEAIQALPEAPNQIVESRIGLFEVIDVKERKDCRGFDEARRRLFESTSKIYELRIDYKCQKLEREVVAVVIRGLRETWIGKNVEAMAMT
ncbi:hypothetical protein CPB83DRAFT_832673 [Crepidotus variabilis]|uniref:Uncharacterized protein n=1 Tax=Crepidotus variabilis TaxID=179855 RepID=A0A9P6EP70_9AGAR|nr:hypothetical protein CPB83DRAFT_832673 [Crepidotus variabilis]